VILPLLPGNAQLCYVISKQDCEKLHCREATLNFDLQPDQ